MRWVWPAARRNGAGVFLMLNPAQVARRMVWGAHLHLDAQRPSKAQQSRGEIASGRRTHPTWITIQGDAACEGLTASPACGSGRP